MFEAFASHPETVSLAAQHGEEIINYMGWITTISLGAVIAVLLWAVKRELATMNETILTFKQEVADDVLLLRDDQKTIWSQISATKSRVANAESEIKLIKNQCKIYHGEERRRIDRSSDEEGK